MTSRQILMARFRLLGSSTLSIVAALAVAGCSSDSGPTSSEVTGSLSLTLVIEGDTEINSVDWVISGGDMEPMSGTVDTSAPGATASVEVFGLPPTNGDDYTITMEATSSDGETMCKGSADFGVDVGQVTDVMVFLNCKRPERFGGVRVNGKFNICAELAKVIVSPLQTSVGFDIDLSAIGEDVEADDITYIWSATGGSIADSNATETTYTCGEAGAQSITIMVSDDGFEYCIDKWTVPVTCVEDGGLCEDVDCSDGNECTDDLCNPNTGQCGNEPVDDGTECNGGAGTCVDGVCVPSPCEGVVCDDTGNECTVAECNPATGECETSNVADGTECDGDAGMCMGGECISDPCEGVICDDTGNECTVAECNPASGQCETSNVADGTGCDGGNGMCVNGDCFADPCEGVVCDDTGNECTVAQCNNQTGECDVMNVPDGTACNSGAGMCIDGNCVSPTGSVFGEVIDTDGSPIAGAMVAVGEQASITNDQGFFMLSDLAADAPAVLTAVAEGHARTTRVITPREGVSTFVQITMSAFDVQTALDPTASATVTAAGSSVEFPAGALDSVEPVTARLTVLDANNPNDLDAFPGEFLTEAGELIETLGVIAIEVTDTDGNPIAMRDGQVAFVEIPVTAGADDEIPLWRLNEATGRWVREGSLTNCSSGICQGQITGLGWWNVDIVLETTCLEVCVVDLEGDPSVGIWVEAQGLDYNGRSSRVTGPDGSACLDVRVSSMVSVVGVSSAGVAGPITHATSNAVAMCGDPSCERVPTCLTIAPPKFQATLLWGEQPTNLDSHFTGPCVPGDLSCEGRFHVFYIDRGSLFDPPFAALDTDDVTSFGPEIVTLNQCFPGVYRYSVHNFSGSPDITESMASVALRLPDGSSFSETVPESNPGGLDTWIVGDLTCNGPPGEPTTDCQWTAINEFGALSAGVINPAGEACVPQQAMCLNSEINPIEPCCVLDAPPVQANACAGTESIENPTSCTSTGSTVRHRLTRMQVEGDCNVGFDLDGCSGTSCIPGGLAPGEGIDGTDNALGGIGPVLVNGNLGGVDQAFANALCGLADGDSMTAGCQPTPIPLLDLGFVVDANAAENCAIVTVEFNDAQVRTALVNLSDTGCLSGQIGSIPFELVGVQAAFDNTALRTTISEVGFSDGLLGVTVDGETAVAVAEALLPGGGAFAGQLFDVNSSLNNNNDVACDALSGTYRIGGVAE